MRKYKTFNLINKNDIKEFGSLEKERLFSVVAGAKILPLEVSCFGITNPDPGYFIVRCPSPCFIIEYIESGVGYLEIDGVLHKLEAGDAYIIHPGDNCRYYADDKNPYKKLWINFRSQLFFDLLSQYKLDERVFRGVDLREYFNRIFELEEISSFEDELCIPASRILYDLVFFLAEQKQKRIQEKNSNIASEIKNILDHSALTPITLDDIAKKLYRSKNDIIRCFKKACGITPYAYLISQRIELAKDLLVTTDKTIKEISKYLCFSSEYYFSNYFKQYVGRSPREYRKEKREQ